MTGVEIEKAIEEYELKFEKPVSESQLHKIILDVVKRLKLHGEWYFEHGYQHNAMVSHVTGENVHGTLKTVSGLTDLVRLETSMRPEYSKKVKFTGLKFKPPLGKSNLQKYLDNINRIYGTFKSNYERMIKK